MFARKTRRSDKRHRHDAGKNATFRVAPYRLNGSKNLHIYCHTQAADKKVSRWKKFVAINFILIRFRR